MTIIEFVSYLNSLGIKIWLEGGQLNYRAPKGVMNLDLKNQLLGRKSEILAFLEEAQTATDCSFEPILSIKRSGDLPLSFAQQRMWFLYQLESQSPFYNEGLQLRVEGVLNIEALQQSVNEIIRRHEILRTTFPAIDGKPLQVIFPSLAMNIPVLDLQGLEAAEIQQIVTKEARQPFDLSNGSLLRVTLLRLGPESHVLVLIMHHIITDGWSMGIFIQELSSLYQTFTLSSPLLLSELPIQYADFAVWQRQWLTEEIQKQQLNYWKQQLAGATPLLELPTDKPRPPVQTFSGATQKFQIDRNLSKQIKTFSQQSGATLFHTLLAAFIVLMFRYSGQDDICIGSPIANRNRREIETLVGFFVNTLVLRHKIEGNPSFNEFLSQVRQVATSAYTHQDVPFEQVVEALQPERSLSYNPLFQVVFVLENFLLDTLELPDVTLTPQFVERGTSQFDLTLAVWDTKQGLIGSWEYNSDLFEPDTIARMTSHFQTLLAAIIANPHQPIGELPLLSQPERHQLLVEWNDTYTPYPKSKCIHQLFEEQVEKTPNAVAVVYEDESLTYQQLNERANQLAQYLRSLGVKPEVLVGICIERSSKTLPKASPLMLVGLLGILKAGGAYVPLDPAYPQERLAFMLEDAQVSVLLTQKSLVTTLPPHQAQVVCLDSATFSTIAENLPHTVTTDNLAYVIYTSGSTGRPKGVQIEHRGLLNLVFWHQQAFAVSSFDRVTQVAGVAFDACGWEIWPYFTAGASIHFPNDETRLYPEQLRNWLLSKAITISFLPTPMAEKILSLNWPANTALRTLLTGGDQLHQYPSTSHPFEVVNNYGPTENTVVTTSGAVPLKQQAYLPPAIGRAIANTQVYILDSLLQPVPIGVTGELYIGGESLARGYLHRPDLTAERFICNPFKRSRGATCSSPAGEEQVAWQGAGGKGETEDQSTNCDRLYKTGDLARYQADGNIEFLGRIDNQVKIRGFRIELSEIEAVLTQHPLVRDAVAITREDIPGVKSLAAYIISELTHPTSNELRLFLKSKLPNYMIPASFTFLEALPITPNGKLDRRALPVPEFESDESTGFVSPHTQWQQYNSDASDEVSLGIADLSYLPPAEQLRAIAIRADEAQRTLNLTDGPLMRVVLFNLGNSPGRLLIVIHHLAVDGISWRILLEDLSEAYKQLEVGKSIQLPAKTTSFKDWAIRLQDYARSQELHSQLDYWLDSMRFPIAPLTLDYAAVAQDNTVASSRIVSVYLSVEQTRALLHDVPGAYNTQINDVLLTALVQTFTRWTGSHSLLIDLEGHGRENLFEDVDLSRTVGWFTSIFPVLLKLEDRNDPGEVLKSVKEQLRRIPNRGIGYGIWRYLSIDESDRNQLQAFPEAKVSFNYLGQFDQTQLATLGWKYAQESSGSIHSPKGQRRHLLTVNGLVVEGRLKVEWQYSEHFHSWATVENLANEYIEALKTIIAHCLSPEAGGYTPSDFPEVEFSQEALDELLAEIN